MCPIQCVFIYSVGLHTRLIKERAGRHVSGVGGVLLGCTLGMGKTVLLRESILSVPVTVTNRLFDSFYIRSIRSRVYLYIR